MASRRKPARGHRTTPRHYRRLAARAPLFALVCGCDTFLPALQSRVGPLLSTGSTHRPAGTRTERPFPAPHRRPAGRHRRVHIGGSRVRHSKIMLTKRYRPRLAAGTAGFRYPALFARHRFGPRYSGQVAGTSCQPPAVESLPVSISQSRAAANPADLAVTAERCAAQLLGGDPAASAEEVAGRLLAIQAQDPRGARLAVRARSAGLSASDVDCRPRAALADRHLAEPRHLAPGPRRGLLVAASADHPAAAHRELPPAGAGGRAAGRRGAGGGRRAGRAGRRRPADPVSSSATGSPLPGCGPKARRWCTSWRWPASGA